MMATSRNASERREDLQEKLGSEFGVAYHELHDRVLYSRIKLGEYNYLYRDTFIVGLMNKFAPLMFFVYQNVLLDSIVLDVTCLIEPARIGKNKNLSLFSLKNFVFSEEESCVKPLTKEGQRIFCSRLGVAEEKGQRLKKYRNKYVAHTDYNSAIEVNDDGITLMELLTEADSTLLACQSVLEFVAERYLDQSFEIEGYWDINSRQHEPGKFIVTSLQMYEWMEHHWHNYQRDGESLPRLASNPLQDEKEAEAQRNRISKGES